MTVNNNLNVNNNLLLRPKNVKNTGAIRVMPLNTLQNPYFKGDLHCNKNDNFESSNKAKQIKILKLKLNKTVASNGLIGKGWDGVKNLFNLKNGSKNVEKLIQKAQNGEISLLEAEERLEAYKEGQKMCVDIFGDIVSGIFAVGSAALSPVTGGLSLLVAAGAGALFKTGIKAADSAFGKRKYEFQDLGYDIITGSINGLMAPLSNAIGGAIGTGVAKALGLNAVETTAKTTIKTSLNEAAKQSTKGFLTNLLQKQGMEYILKEGSKGGLKSFIAKILAYGADMTVDGALSGATDAFSRSLASGKLENSSDDILKSALGGALGGLLIGGSTRLIFKGASKLKTHDSPSSPAPSIKTGSSSNNISALSLNASKNIEIDSILANVDFSKQIKPDSEELMAIAKAIAKRNEILEEAAFSEFKGAVQANGITCSSRAKAIESTFNKLNSKVKSGSIIKSFEDAYKLIADGVGTRAVFKSLSFDEAILALKNAGIKDSEIDILKTIWKRNSYDGLDDASNALLLKANKVLAGAQTQDFVTKLIRAIENNEISITEINNYAGKDGIAYFSEEQIMQIYKAWEKSASTGDFGIVTKAGKDSELAKMLGFDSDYLEEISKKSSKPSGYTACQSNFKYKNGAIGEGQFRGEEINAFAEYEHFPYDIRKEKTTVQQKINELILAGKKDVAAQFSEYQDLVRFLATDKNLYNQYNDYLRSVYNYLRKKELGILSITGEIPLPVLHIDGLSPHQLELLSKECLESLSKQELYTFKNP